jgi:lysophospholipase L1-like esterase
MKTRIIAAVALLCIALGTQAQKHEFANWKRYANANKELGAPAKGEKRVVLMGNSITDGWPGKRPEFFKDNNLIGRGIGGQTSYQFLLRFREDVINLQPKVVVINYGTNDVAENTGAYDENLTYGNVLSMVELARFHKCKVILTSCLPAAGFSWHASITDAMDKIRSLNARVKAYAEANKIPYVDYFSAMVNAEGTGMKPELAQDTPGVHPNEAGYAIMESLLLPVIKKLR